MSTLNEKYEKQHKRFQEIISQKIADTSLRANLKTAMNTLRTKRKALLAQSYPEWEDLREKASQIKKRCLSKLPELLETFERHCQENGMTVHWANDAEEANKIVLELIRKNNVKVVTKGKSMISEEIGFNHFLEKNDVKVVETDLGELIIQLDHETPVHIVVPAVHKNRKEVGKTFHDKLGAEYTEDIPSLNAIARKTLRGYFQEVKMGISGVNFAIAETGSIWLIENEGNGRMCTTSPDIHVALCGIEKVVETLKDAATLNRLLSTSATGQKTTCYNNIISSPRRTGEKDGPKEVHIVLIDNNRTNILGDKDLYESLKCIRCGSCLNHCPVYDKIGGHAYLATYPGPIGTVISPQIFGMEEFGEMTKLCSLCGNCSEVCPVKIPLDKCIRHLRNVGVDGKDSKVLGAGYASGSFINYIFKAAAFTFYVSPIHNFRLSMLPHLRPIVSKFGHLLPVLKNWCKYRTAPVLAKKSLHNMIKDGEIEGVTYE